MAKERKVLGPNKDDYAQGRVVKGTRMFQRVHERLANIVGRLDQIDNRLNAIKNRLDRIDPPT